MCRRVSKLVLWARKALIGAGIAAAIVVLGACASPAPLPEGGEAVARSNAGSFRAVIRTDGGDLILLFDLAAAPQAVAAIRAAFERQDWDGVAMEWVRPHTEIRTGLPRGATPMPSELDARALGLHELRIEDEGAAMNAIQFELEPAFLRAGAAASPQLRDWISTWRQDFDAGFLVGVSRQQINEALGYRYQNGYATRAARRGSVALVPDKKAGQTSLALSILLRDQPPRDGRWVVVGEVESGLEFAETLSIAPRLHPKSFEPERPARILRTEVTNSIHD